MTQPTGLYGWIQSNDGRSTGLFLGFLAAIQLVAPLALVGPLIVIDIDHAPFFAWGGYLLRYAPLVLAASIAWFAAQLWWHVETVKRAVDFHFVDAGDEPRLCRVIEPLIILTGLPVPFVGVIESDARNAFACGIGRKKAVVVVTRGLIDALDDHELASVLAHELSHIRNGDIRLMAAANIFMSTLGKLHAKNALRFTPVHGVLALAIPAVLPLCIAGSIVGRLALKAGQVSRLLIASSREFIADAESAQWTQNPAALASALLKVDGRHRIDHARAEDDAMMIAGDSEGHGATHPTVAQRVAALARVTGSMVFNAPSAPRPGDWTATTTPEAVANASFGRRANAAQALARVRRGDGENFLGLTLWGTLALVATIGGLIGIHASELHNPRAMIAKFDLRPIGVLIGTPLACEMSFYGPSFRKRCDEGMSDGAYRDFEGQHGTLAGWLADKSRKRRESGIANADVTAGNIGLDQVRSAYRGQSGRLQGVSATQSSDGLFSVGGSSFSSRPPEALVIAEIDKVGCFPHDRLPPTDYQPLSLADETPGGLTIASMTSDVQNSVITGAGSAASLRAALSYVDQRENFLGVGDDFYGAPGLTILAREYASPAHADIVAGLRQALPVLLKTATPLQAAKLRALTRDPAAFVPCTSLKR